MNDEEGKLNMDVMFFSGLVSGLFWYSFKSQCIIPVSGWQHRGGGSWLATLPRLGLCLHLAESVRRDGRSALLV